MNKISELVTRFHGHEVRSYKIYIDFNSILSQVQLNILDFNKFLTYFAHIAPLKPKLFASKIDGVFH